MMAFKTIHPNGINSTTMNFTRSLNTMWNTTKSALGCVVAEHYIEAPDRCPRPDAGGYPEQCHVHR